MPGRDWRFRLDHIVEAIDYILGYTQGLTFEQFCQNSMAVHATIHNFEIVGEAARNVPQALKDQHPEVPWQDMIDMRNVVAHHYFGIELTIIWRTIQNNLPPLAIQIRDILDSHDDV
ncbi:MAG: DUF86 domain-containing protein [SAR202 cluster bacterium]|jgi:uncharacterized protein with HEPN domain|nr:DUF86 domain-containing protein [Chloroflexota bacterium]MDP6665023.1 DUF86 domain-containing protein [SAR202 cluster bacterium]HAL47285.1 DUF86 domain-containing protein [Dehalococcoidia bacterium]MDP6801485.1 DUF86 domain-containing protein [SAR202 cluster bacterium]MQG59524.1 DUF86 domain-containing protein [SAR202 cluster bacterium]|tara:strand:+ start:3705 stop:4055 length:351 start_codon:yes stop_codon:yes gene_type:complete